MICPFCSQWNPEGDRRCSFCNNEVEGGEDATVAARPKYAARALEITRALPSSYDLPRATRPRPHFKLTLTPDQAIGAAVALLVLLILAASRC